MEHRVACLGDSAWLVEWSAAGNVDALVARSHGLRHLLESDPEKPAGVLDIVAAFASLAVHYEPQLVDGNRVRAWIGSWLGRPLGPAWRDGTLHEIPVCYGGGHGPDLDAVAKACGMSAEEVVALHAGTVYTVAMVGFSPGFPYLTGLDERLHLPRLASPRTRVAAGSVAIASDQAGIYPCDSAGGWHILGRARARWFDPMRLPSPSLMQAGDRVRFVPVAGIEPAAASAPPTPCAGDLEVIEPGFATTVQAACRTGFQSVGVSPGGAVDAEALRVANLLLGNAESAAALELCVMGPTLRFHRDTRVVLAGADSSGGMGNGRVREVHAGEMVQTGSLIGSLRAILAVAGGINAPEILGSSSTDLRSGFGGSLGRALAAGDRLALNAAPAPVPKVGGVSLARPVGRDLCIRYLIGPQASWFDPAAIAAFEGGPFEATTRQDRMGMRLQGVKIEPTQPREMRSQPVCTGSIQIPPEGRPMILLAERQTHGGYPQIGCVITADLPKLARALPGTRIRFRRVTLPEAWRELADARRDLQRLRAGLAVLTQ